MTPASELGGWLRGQRRGRGWNVPEMVRRLRQAASGSGDVLPRMECLATMVRRWERGDSGVSERYLLHYCGAFGIEPGQFGPPGWLPASGRAAAAVTAAAGGPALGVVVREICDSFREAAKSCQGRAERLEDPALAALCRGQALAYTAAADNLDAVLAARGT